MGSKATKALATSTQRTSRARALWARGPTRRPCRAPPLRAPPAARRSLPQARSRPCAARAVLALSNSRARASPARSANLAPPWAFSCAPGALRAATAARLARPRAPSAPRVLRPHTAHLPARPVAKGSLRPRRVRALAARLLPAPTRCLRSVHPPRSSRFRAHVRDGVGGGGTNHRALSNLLTHLPRSVPHRYVQCRLWCDCLHAVC